MDPALRTAALAHYDELARLGRALASPVRLRLVDLLRQGPRSVEVLAEAAGVSVANVSQHLQQLRAAHLVTGERHGQQIVYRLAHEDVGGLFVALRALGEAVLPEVDRLQQTLHVHPSEHRGLLLQKAAAGEITLLDVRPTEEWQGGHLLDALHIPLPELATRVVELPKKRPVVAYCRGPYCPMALSAVGILRAAGFVADHLDLGPADLAAGTGLARRLVVLPAAPASPRPKPRATRAGVPSAPTPRAKTRSPQKKKTSRRSPR